MDVALSGQEGRRSFRPGRRRAPEPASGKKARLGDWGEAVAARQLERMGWRVLDRNYRAGRKEIDLVVRRGRLVAFVEVKTRSSTRWGHPLEGITTGKVAQLTAAAHGWAERYGSPELVYRFDAVSVMALPGRAPRVEHLEDAWRPVS